MTACLIALVLAQTPANVADRLRIKGLNELGAHRMLTDLCTNIGNRIAGSDNAARAVAWAEAQMKGMDLANVRQIACKVPHWVRGPVEKAQIVGGDALTICALGGSAGTPAGGVTAEVIEVHSLDEVGKLGDAVKGKIVFYNRPFDQSLPSPFAAYGAAGDQRFAGPAVAAKTGAVATLVRSMTHDHDDVPHTGTTRFQGVAPSPAAALGLASADKLSRMLKADPHLKVTIELSCEKLPDVDSASVIGEIVGSENPNEVIVLGGHLDSWDKGQGAHDDGAGVTQSLEALRLLAALGLHPKRTIRAVAFMDEESGGEGAEAYAAWVKGNGEKPYMACESDSGGFMPRGFGVTQNKLGKVRGWQKHFAPFGIERFTAGGGGADVGPLAPLGATLFGLQPEGQRYFDYHHSDKDTIDKVNPRELEMGAIAMALLAWMVSEQGL